MNLVIVESPTKARSIEKYLGKNYLVLACFGHVRDLPEKSLGVKVRENFKPIYRVSAKKEIVEKLKKEAEKASKIILATDLDREGEAIAWHLKELLKLPESKIERVTFDEITKEAILKAFKNPRKINQALVNAQIARRVLDRLVGYNLSPLLWQKIRKGLSAGRVQSVALRLIVEREEEIEEFKPVEYWSIKARLLPQKKKQSFLADLWAIAGKKIDKLEIKTKEEAERLVSEIKQADFLVAKVKSALVSKLPAPPFITSTLEQEANRRLRFSAKKTITLAQMLYESGYITYMRTDSPHLSSQAIAGARKVIEESFGNEYLPERGRIFSAKSRTAQEAHEAIRPTDFQITKEDVSLSSDAGKLYEMIWQRTVASQMKEAIFRETSAEIQAGKYTFLAKGSHLEFPGFLKVYGEIEKGDSEESELPSLSRGEPLQLLELLSKQNFTQPPPRYSEATLIKTLEKEGVGRPSTYALIISTLLERGYVKIVEGKLVPEDIGRVVAGLLKEHFAEIVDIKFTAEMEEDLDKIAAKEKEWQGVIASFYFSFEKKLTRKKEELKKEDFIEVTSQPCPKCGEGKKVVRFGKFGRFFSCSRFPECDYKESLNASKEKKEVKRSDKKCPKCGGNLLERKSRYGKFLGCENYPKCTYIESFPVKTFGKCPKCGGEIVLRKTKKGRIFYGCNNFPKCSFASWQKP